MIELEDVHKAYVSGTRTQPVLAALSYTVASGESVALLGPSGSGKSTLLNLLAGLDLPDRGRVRVLSQELGALGDDGRTLLRRRHLGFVFQFFNLMPSLSVLDNLLLPQSLLGVHGARARQRALEMLEAVGLADRADSYADTLSGGEQQRVAIARAVVHEPDIVLADEPTGNLDAETARRVLDLLDRLVVRPGRILVMATHSERSAAICNAAVTIRDGALTSLPQPS
ncbi:MAG: ABC transporter ATP-binding protein [Pseudomonadota bacterium]